MNTRRQHFHDGQAAALARRAGVVAPQVAGSSTRFVCFEDDSTYTMVAGRFEKQGVDLGLAYGLTDAEGRDLRLVLPEGLAGATLQRAAWLKAEHRPEVFVYRGYDAVPERVATPTRARVIESYDRFQSSLAEDFRRTTLPLHLGDRQSWVAPLVDWVSGQHEVDPGHRQGQRAWHCRGQKVLEIRRQKAGLVVVAGIQSKGRHDRLVIDGPLTDEQLEGCQSRVRQGTEERLEDNGAYHRADEHWMQAVIRRNPRLVGLEMTSLREVPAWRRTGSLSTTARSSWGRGFIDLLGVDPAGTIQVVETKMGTKDDAMLVLQALDYYVYCEAYREAVTRRLDVVVDAPLAMRCVVGAPRDAGLRLNRFVPAQLDALDDSVDRSFMALTNWFRRPREPEAKTSGLMSAEDVAGLVRGAYVSPP